MKTKLSTYESNEHCQSISHILYIGEFIENLSKFTPIWESTSFNLDGEIDESLLVKLTIMHDRRVIVGIIFTYLQRQYTAQRWRYGISTGIFIQLVSAQFFLTIEKHDKTLKQWRYLKAISKDVPTMKKLSL